MDYYLFQDGEQTGPHAESDLRAALQTGALQPGDLAWCEGAADWTPLSELLPAPPIGVPTPAAEPTPQGELATPRQRAFLSFMGVTPPAHATRQQAAVLVNDAMEKDPSRLARWNDERLQLHPDIFAEEIQARKEGRALKFYDHCQREGRSWFEKVAKAHCQVLVGHLDVHSPQWDAVEAEAVEKHFFPALAQKFPQLLTPEGRVHFKAADQPRSSHVVQRSAPVSRSPQRASAGRKFFALVRGAICGGLILAGLWFGRGPIEKWLPAHLPVAAIPEAETPAKSAAPVPDKTPAEPAPKVASEDVPAPVANATNQ